MSRFMPDFTIEDWRQCVRHNVELYKKAHEQYYNWAHEVGSEEERQCTANWLSINESLAVLINEYASAVKIEDLVYVPHLGERSSHWYTSERYCMSA